MSTHISALLNNCLAFCNLPGSSQKKVLQNIADKLQQSIPALSSAEIFENLITREKLGSTSIGKGVAIPHCRAKGINEPVCCIIKLTDPVDFEAPDELPVDLLFVMIIPEQLSDEHLQALNDLALLFEQSELRNSLRKSHKNQELLAAMQKTLSSH